MTPENNILAIVKYAKVRYGLDISNSKDETVIKTAVYLARIKQDKHLSGFVSEYSLQSSSQKKMEFRQKSIPILKKSISVQQRSRARAI